MLLALNFSHMNVHHMIVLETLMHYQHPEDFVYYYFTYIYFMIQQIISVFQAPPHLPKPEMYSLRVESQIKSRYARTVVSSRLANPANKSQEVFFSVILPETAFISGFLM
jgi:Vault protein inter-alpha-trypsin.